MKEELIMIHKILTNPAVAVIIGFTLGYLIDEYYPIFKDCGRCGETVFREGWKYRCIFCTENDRVAKLKENSNLENEKND